MKVWQRFSFKIFTFMFAIALSVVLTSSLIFYYLAEQKLVTGLAGKAKELSLEAAAELQSDIVLYQDLLSGKISQKNAESLIENQLRLMQLSLGPQGVENIYTLAFYKERLYVVGDPDPSGGLPLSVIDTNNLDIKLKTFFEKKAYTTLPYSDTYGTWISGYAPILDKDGDTVAIVGIDLPLGAFHIINEVLQENIFINLLVAILLSIVVSFLASKQLSKPLIILTRGLEKIRDNQFDIQLEVTSSDELGHIAETFNQMVGGLREKKHMNILLRQAVSPEIAEALLENKVSAQGELIEGTVLFADIRGFTALSETLSAQDVITLINDYLKALVPVILSKNGVIDKFVGDEVMALFGVPQKLANDPLSAVEAALEMQKVIEALNKKRKKEGKPTPEMGIGINTGVLIAGSVGTTERQNYTVLGSTVNIAARLCSLAKSRQIIINQSTYLRISDKITAKKLPPVEVKGVRFPLSVFQVN